MFLLNLLELLTCLLTKSLDPPRRRPTPGSSQLEQGSFLSLLQGFRGVGFRLFQGALLGGSWVVINGVKSRVTILITHIRVLITPLITTHEHSSTVFMFDSTIGSSHRCTNGLCHDRHWLPKH